MLIFVICAGARSSFDRSGIVVGRVILLMFGDPVAERSSIRCCRVNPAAVDVGGRVCSVLAGDENRVSVACCLE